MHMSNLVREVRPGSPVVPAPLCGMMVMVVEVIKRCHGGRGIVMLVVVGAPRVHLELITVQRVGL